ncbi:SDR family NAD(P)-dependent oxidoreductase [Amycolatopsis sp. NPDC051903]|uniref:SDR family NAD(P)-dependent oxidoreductase n=1 Tax=Amycolatopsis sp. NPDC051903 TaxID=3363936 RepID=UPI0037B2AD76
MARLEGLVALVTGAGSGIGEGVLRRFVREGARVVAMGRDAERLRKATEPLGAAVVAMPGDVTDPADCRGAVELALGHFGKLDVLVPNAGVHDQNAALSGMSVEELEAAYAEVFTVNVKGALLIVHAALPALIEARGSIIFTGSISSVVPGFGGALYVPSKHAVVGLAKQLAFELAGRVRVNTVAPGYVSTNLTAPQALGGGAVLPDPEQVARRLPTGFAPGPDDVAGVYALLASQVDGSAITGSVFSVDSGQQLWGPPHGTPDPNTPDRTDTA